MAEQPIKGSEIIQPDWAANATKSANDLDAALQHLIQHTGILASNSKKVFPSADPKTIADLNAQNQAIEKSVELQKQDIQAKTIAAEVNKKVRDEIKASLSDYSRLSLEYRKAAQNAKDLAAADTLRGKAFGEATKEAIFKANGLNDQLKKIDQSMGNYNRNVGNYASGFNSLGNSINQLTREAPAFANSLNTGFMALSNNIPILFDAISKTKNEIKALRAEGQQVPGLFSQLTTSLFSWGTALSLGVTLLTLYGGKIANWVISLFKAQEATKGLTELEKKESDEIKHQTHLIEERNKQREIENEFAVRRLKLAGAEEQQVNNLTIAQNNEKIRQNKVLLDNLQVFKNLYNTTYENLSDADRKFLDEKMELMQQIENENTDLSLSNQELMKNTKELNKVIYGDTLSFADLLELMIKINEQYRDANTEESKLVVNVGNVNAEYNRRKQILNEIAGLAGESSTNPKALTEKELDEQEKANLKKLDNAKKLNDAIFKLSEDRIKAEQNLNKQQLSQIDTQLQQQFELLKNGQKNTYDFMLKQKAAALEEQAKLDKKARKEKEAEQLVNIFLEFLKADIAAGGGKNGFGAAAKALAQTALAKGLAEGLSGFYEGTEDTGSGGGLDSKGGMLAVLHPHERVLTAKQNAMIGSLSNDELVNSIFKYNVGERKGDLKDSGNEILIQEVQELNRTIKNKKELQVDWNRLNEIILTEKANGLTTETTYKNSPIIHRQKPFSRN